MKKVHFKYYNFNEFVEFLKGLPIKDRRKLLGLIKMIEIKGLPTAMMMQWVKKLSGHSNLYEIRSRFAKNYQRCLYFHLIGNTYVVTNYFSKKTNKTPNRVIHKAIIRRNQYLNRRSYDGRN